MRKLLILLFLILTAVLAFYAWTEFASVQIHSPYSEDMTDGSGGSAEPGDSDPNLAGSVDGRIKASRAYSMSTPNLTYSPIQDSTKELKQQTLELADTTVDEKRKSAKELVSYAHSFGWAGSICSWLILAITIFLQNTAPDNVKEKPDKRKPLPAKSGMIGFLAVGAAVCPLTSSKIEDDAIEYHSQIETILEEVSVLEKKGSQLTDEQWKDELRRLKNTILR